MSQKWSERMFSSEIEIEILSSKKHIYDYNWECAHINNFLFYTFHLTLIHVKQFSKVVIPIYIPSTMYESNGCLTSLSKVSIVGLFNFSHSGGCVTVFHCSFNLKFSNDYCFFLFIGHLVVWVFFCEVPVEISGLFSIQWVNYMYANIFSHLVCSLFTIEMVSLDEQKFLFYFNMANLSKKFLWLMLFVTI